MFKPRRAAQENTADVTQVEQVEHVEQVVKWRRTRRLTRWITSGSFAVDTGHYTLLLAGTISSPVMLYSTLWITICATAPGFVTAIEPVGSVLTSLAFVSFALLPEVITYKAIVKCLRLYRMTARTHEQQGNVTVKVSNAERWTRATWGILYTLPTIAFICMTLATLLPFTLSHGQVSAISGYTLGIRCAAGWFYVLIGLIEAELAKGEEAGSDDTQVWYTRLRPVTRQAEYTIPCQVTSTSVHLPDTIQAPEAVSPITRKEESHSETIIETLETEHEVHVDTVASTSQVQQHEGTVKTTRKHDKRDVSKSSVNKTEWIRSKFVEYPDASISDIQQLAVSEGFTVSRGLVSNARV